MKKIILTAVILSAFIYVNLVDYSYAEDVLRDSVVYIETEGDEDNATITLAQAYNEPAEEEREEGQAPAEEEPEEEEEYISSKYDAMPAE